MHKILEKKITSKKAVVGVIGLGYVGLPLALAFHKAGFTVYGFDKNQEKIGELKRGNSYIDDIKKDAVQKAYASKTFIPESNFENLGNCDVIIIAVPTPLTRYQTPDLSFITSATNEIAQRLKKNQLIILESTTYPGTTDEVVLPILQKAAELHKPPLHFYLAFSPERVDPGNKTYTITNTPKVVGGINAQSGHLAALLYLKCVERVVPVSNARTAEMTKLLENIFRIVNISLVNELALLSERMHINIWEVIEAAATKPYGFMPFYPGPGVGGHCIAIDPFYLSYKAREYGFFTRFIDLAGEINEMMPHFVVTKVTTALNYVHAKSINKSKILIVGVSYKKDIKDTRESAAIPIAKDLLKKGAHVSFFDPFIDRWIVNKTPIQKVRALNREAVARYDVVLIVTDHRAVPYDIIASHARSVVDTRNALKNMSGAHIYRI